MNKHNKPMQLGVSLIEVLVAILIVSFGVLGLIGLQARATQFSVGAEDRNRAALLANEIATDLSMRPTPIVVSSDDLARWRALAASSVPNGTVSVSPLGSTASIEVLWQATSASNASRFVTDVVIP
jgi:type IV pilus assembly protein PilV